MKSFKRSPRRRKKSDSLQTQTYDSPPRRSLLDLGLKDNDPTKSFHPLSEINNLPSLESPEKNAQLAVPSELSSSPSCNHFDSEADTGTHDQDHDVGTLNKKKRQNFRRSIGSSKKYFSNHNPIYCTTLRGSTNATILPPRVENQSPDLTKWESTDQEGFIARATHPWSTNTSFEQATDLVEDAFNFPDDPFSNLTPTDDQAKEGMIRLDDTENIEPEIFTFTSNPVIHGPSVVFPIPMANDLQKSSVTTLHIVSDQEQPGLSGANDDDASMSSSICNSFKISCIPKSNAVKLSTIGGDKSPILSNQEQLKSSTVGDDASVTSSINDGIKNDTPSPPAPYVESGELLHLNKEKIEEDVQITKENISGVKKDPAESNYNDTEMNAAYVEKELIKICSIGYEVDDLHRCVQGVENNNDGKEKIRKSKASKKNSERVTRSHTGIGSRFGEDEEEHIKRKDTEYRLSIHEWRD